MKKVLGVMVFMSVIIINGAGIIALLISKILGGGIEQTFIYPLYVGQILLSGIVVACSHIIFEELKIIKKEILSLKDKTN